VKGILNHEVPEPPRWWQAFHRPPSTPLSHAALVWLVGHWEVYEQTDETQTRSRNKAGGYLLHLSNHLIGHIRATFREVSTPINGDASLIGRFQRTLRVEGIPIKRRVPEVGRSLTGATNS